MEFRDRWPVIALGGRTPYITTMGWSTLTESDGTSASPELFEGAFFTVEQAAEKPKRAANASFNFLFMVDRSIVSMGQI